MAWNQGRAWPLHALLAAGWIAALTLSAEDADAATLRAAANNNFVSATATGSSYLTATAGAANSWEQFDVVNNGNGTVSFRARISGNFVSADIGLAAPNTGRLIANRRTADAWEQFVVVPQANGTVAL